MPILSRFTRVIQVSLSAYVAIAILYTTNYFIIFPLHAEVSAVWTRSLSKGSSTPWPSLLSNPFASSTAKDRYLKQTALKNSQFSLDLFDFPNDAIQWVPSDFTTKHLGPEYANLTPVMMSEDLFLSKAFAQSMGPSKIIPFFYRAAGEFDKEDITLTTLVTSNRFKVFTQLVENYQGPVSVTIHVKSTPADLETLFFALHTLYTSTPSMSTYVDVHLVIDQFDRQFNTWRNIARLFARTDFVMMLDVDFAVCTNFRRSVRESEAVMKKLKEGASAFVIPAFEYIKFNDGIDQATFPRDKQSLVSLVQARRMGMFHRSWGPGHNSTDYNRFYAAPPGEVYKVTQYQSAYEPYVIFKKDGPPWCDERFVGYGGNKAACLFEMYLSGISFYVLSDHFLVHQNHLYEEAARKHERKYNRKIYSDFKEEACLRYLKRHYEDGTLNTTTGHNVQDECKKIKGVSRIAAQDCYDAFTVLVTANTCDKPLFFT